MEEKTNVFNVPKCLVNVSGFVIQPLGICVTDPRLQPSTWQHYNESSMTYKYLINDNFIDLFCILISFSYCFCLEIKVLRKEGVVVQISITLYYVIFTLSILWSEEVEWAVIGWQE